jgi:hypothetical protein
MTYPSSEAIKINSDVPSVNPTPSGWDAESDAIRTRQSDQSVCTLDSSTPMEHTL